MNPTLPAAKPKAAAKPRRRRAAPSVVRPATISGLAALAPLLAAAVAVAAGGVGPLGREAALTGLIGYGALLLSFIGGVGWGALGRAELHPAGTQAFLLTLLPVLAAWTGLLLPPLTGLAVLAAATAAQGVVDVWAADAGASPAWYGRLRLYQTLAVEALLAATFVSVALSGGPPPG